MIVEHFYFVGAFLARLACIDFGSRLCVLCEKWVFGKQIKQITFSTLIPVFVLCRWSTWSPRRTARRRVDECRQNDASSGSRAHQADEAECWRWHSVGAWRSTRRLRYLGSREQWRRQDSVTGKRTASCAREQVGLVVFAKRTFLSVRNAACDDLCYPCLMFHVDEVVFLRLVLTKWNKMDGLW